MLKSGLVLIAIMVSSLQAAPLISHETLLVNEYRYIVNFVLQAINSDRVVIFSRTTCPFSDLAKAQFDRLNTHFFAIELDNLVDSDEIQDVLEQITGARTVPRVFVRGQFIGGGTDMVRMYYDGSLARLLAS